MPTRYDDFPDETVARIKVGSADGPARVNHQPFTTTWFSGTDIAEQLANFFAAVSPPPPSVYSTDQHARPARCS